MRYRQDIHARIKTAHLKSNITIKKRKTKKKKKS